MQTIAITPPAFYPGEAQAIAGILLNRGFWRVHIRKPDAAESAIRALIEEIPAELRPRLSIHNALHLAEQYGLGGVHLNRHTPLPPQGWHGLISRSIHSIAEIDTLSNEDYAFISPVFPSISKPGYNPTFTIGQLSETIRRNQVNRTRIFALGGVTPARLPRLESAGFAGAAMLSEAWRPQIPADNFKLQFITHPTGNLSVVDGARKALEGGCRWIQLRWKDASTGQLIDAGREIAAMCRRHNATFIIDDHVSLVHHLRADGVHLGQNDMTVSHARAILGPMKIIGATANTLPQMVQAGRRLYRPRPIPVHPDKKEPLTSARPRRLPHPSILLQHRHSRCGNRWNHRPRHPTAHVNRHQRNSPLLNHPLRLRPGSPHRRNPLNHQ